MSPRCTYIYYSKGHSANKLISSTDRLIQKLERRHCIVRTEKELYYLKSFPTSFSTFQLSFFPLPSHSLPTSFPTFHHRRVQLPFKLGFQHPFPFTAHFYSNFSSHFLSKCFSTSFPVFFSPTPSRLLFQLPTPYFLTHFPTDFPPS